MVDNEGGSERAPSIGSLGYENDDFVARGMPRTVSQWLGDGYRCD